MNKEDILKILEGAEDKNGDVPMRLVRLAFKKLPEPCTDTISRQAAIDAVEESRRLNHHKDGKEACLHEYEHRHFLKILRDLPSAQPEIVSCKDCYHYPSKYADCPMIGWARNENDFCSKAERRGIG